MNTDIKMKSILTDKQLALSIKRLAHQILENHIDLDDTVIIGMQPRGIYVSDRLVQEVKTILGRNDVNYGKLDITFYRDDIHRNDIPVANQTDISFNIESKTVILVDDVLWTGRTVRAAMDALIDFGRPAKVELCVLIDRRFNRELPIQANYVGRTIDTYTSQKVKVYWSGKDGATQDHVELID